MILIKSMIVGLGGAIGSIIRFLIGLIPLNETTSFPINTFIVNVIGAIAIGFIVFYASENFDENWLLFLKVGICGGFTTFSTFAIETSALLKNGNPALAFLYVFLTVLVGVSAVFLPDLLSLR
ncbi:fluoride efflux transporter CrcB [Methanobrevibacter sp.]